MTTGITKLRFGPELTLLLVLAGSAAARPAAATDTTCANCHASATTRQQPQMNLYFLQWQGSAHDQAGVDCFGCHGGNRQAQDPAAAHAGMKLLQDPQEIILACGACHPGQLANFQKSRHYARLLHHENAPNCVTCHGARTASALSPDKVPQICAHCHNPEAQNHPNIPEETRQIFGLYQTLLDDLSQADASIQQAQAQGRPVEANLQKLRLAQTMLIQMRETWHAFALNDTQDLIFRTDIIANQAISTPSLWQRIPLWVMLAVLAGLAAIVVIAGLARRGRPSAGK